MFTAKTQEDALVLATRHFLVPEDEIEYTILENGSKGLFGIGTKDSVIEAWVEPELLVKAFLFKLLEKMGFPTEVDCYQKDESIIAELTSSFAGAIIGRRGETLDSLQYLTTLYLNRFHSSEQYIRVTLDIENYRAKRE